MKALLDTHFVLWIVSQDKRIDDFPWLERYRPWGVSPVSFLEIQFLHESGRIEARVPELIEAIGSDPRFTVDEVPLEALIIKSIGLSWTRDPFDRLLAGHSEARRTPLCTLDRRMRVEHRYIVKEVSAA